MKMNEYNLGLIELAGESYPSEIDYEIDPEDGYVLIHAVRLVKKVCEKDGVWYDPNGDFHCGEKWIRLDITGFLSGSQIRMFAEEIMASAEDGSEECAVERWIEDRNGPHHYLGVPVT